MSVHPTPHGISHLRCSDEDRELVAQVLNNAYTDGRLDFEEHSERITRAYNAKTFADLDPLTVDLIPPAGPQPTPPATPRPLPHATPHPLPAATPTAPTPAGIDDFRGARAILSSYRREGPIVLPPTSEITAVMGEAKIDLVEATFTARDTQLRVNVVMGEVRIRVPLNVRVINDVSNILSEYKSDGILADPNAPVLRISGTALLGAIHVLGPDTKQRKYDRFI